MERNIDEFLQDPEQQTRLETMTEGEFYSELEKNIYEAIMTQVSPFQNIQPTNSSDTNLEPLSLSKSTREYAYGGNSATVVRRQDKINLSKNKDLNILKSTIRSAFEAIIAASNKTELSSQVLSALKQTEKRLDQQIEQRLKAEEKNT